MPIYFKKVKNNNQNSPAYGKWYAQGVVLGAVTTNQLAEQISHSTTVTYADTVAVLAELAVVMKNHLQESRRVILDGIGSFKVSISSIGSQTKKDVNANNIKRYRIIFRPMESVYMSGLKEDGTPKKFFVKEFLRGVSASLLPSEAQAEAAEETGGEEESAPKEEAQE
ncbi:MAG: HU family DNA-binding protein [Prevotella sp.]|jgi:predicted histone-like DNA-binding protein